MNSAASEIQDWPTCSRAGNMGIQSAGGGMQALTMKTRMRPWMQWRVGQSGIQPEQLISHGVGAQGTEEGEMQACDGMASVDGRSDMQVGLAAEEPCQSCPLAPVGVSPASGASGPVLPNGQLISSIMLKPQSAGDCQLCYFVADPQHFPALCAALRCDNDPASGVEEPSHACALHPDL